MKGWVISLFIGWKIKFKSESITIKLYEFTGALIISGDCGQATE